MHTVLGHWVGNGYRAAGSGGPKCGGRARRAAAAAAGAMLVATTSLVLSAGPASAGVGLAATPDWPSTVTVGQTGLPGSLDVPNRSNGGEAVGNVTLSALTLVPACGALTNGDCPPASADPGVFQLSSSGTGALPACAGKTFTIAMVDAAQGKVQFTPSSPVVLGPPGGANDTCRINFTFNVLKAPTKDALPGMPGVQTAQLGAAAGTHDTALPGTGTGTDVTTVVQATPTLVTQVAPGTVTVGQTFTDTATITGSPGAPAPTGTVTFTVHQDEPGKTPCSGKPLTLGPIALAATSGSSPPVATATSPPVTATDAGTYRFRVSYSGDANYTALPDSPCNDPNENVTVKLTPSIATQVTPTSGTTVVGQTVSDTATVTGTQGGPVPTGTVTFTAHFDAPGAAACSGPSQILGPIALVAGPAGNPPTATAASGPSTATGPGTYRFRATYNGDANYGALPITACNIPSENVIVTKAAPRIVTTASETVVVGGTVRDTATLSNGVNPTGTITFALFGPDNASCSGTPAFTSSRLVNGNGAYTSDAFTPTATGKYRFVATYGGDANNDAAGPTACNDPDEDVDVTSVVTTTTTTTPPGTTATSITPGASTPPPTVQGTLLTLPVTGAGAAVLSRIALVVLLVGGALTVVTWRRRTAVVEPPSGTDG